ncbi:hypothetical protein ABBQ32_012859 [Trebouxia sp. C0010 RCD-2024]
MADELDWLEMLVASERVEEWLCTVCGSENSLASRRAAMQQLAQAAMEREAYAEEARQAGAVSRLTKVLANTEDLVLKQALVKFCTHEELIGAFRHKSRTIKYGELCIDIKEGALGDGLGARVWVVAHTLCRELLKHPAVVADKTVLEIGSGCGLCGILAAKLGAAQVVLTDHEEKVLHNLRDCVAANCDAASETQTAAMPMQAAMAAATRRSAAAEMHDPEDADSCDDLDDFFSADNAQPAASPEPMATSSWDFGNVHVRHLDWEESIMAGRLQQAAQSGDTTNTSTSTGSLQNQPGMPSQEQASSAPCVALEEKFEVVIGTDILYEEAHSKLVAAVLRHRLTMNGQAIICCAVRDQAIFDQFSQQLEAQNMQVKTVTVEPQAEDHGIIGKQHDYEGGFVLMAVKHTASVIRWHGTVLSSTRR